MPDDSGHLSGLLDILGEKGLLTDVASRLVYARDASHLTLGRPLAVALPGDDDQLRRVVRWCRERRVPVVGRGTGTGLSGGAVPAEGALVVCTSRLTGLGPVDGSQRSLRVQPGVLNDVVSLHAATDGLYFAPDPSSQSAASIGGNIAENAGGPHCLRHGVTLQHLLGLEWCDAGGRNLRSGRGLPAERGLDLLSLLCGSEGTLGLVTAADLKLVPVPEDVATLLAIFPKLEDAARAVVRLLSEGLAPVAVEMVDQAMLLAVEEAFGFGFPTDVEAAMITEFAGRTAAAAEDCERAVALLMKHGAREVRRAADESERADLWRCRKKAFGAVGRLAPKYVTMDVVVPLGELPGLVRKIQDIKLKWGVEIATTFHAGDGNLHPGVHYDDRNDDQSRCAHAAADAIIKAGLERGGSVTGEHGVGIEKLHALPWQIDGETARLQRGIKEIFDPTGILNPGKLHPPADAAFAAVKPPPSGIDFQWANLTVSAPADASLAEIQTSALERGFWIPVGVFAEGDYFGLGLGGTVGDLVSDLLAGPSLCPAGTVRDFLLELWAETGDGHLFHAGAPVFKNVAGYDLAHMLCGSGRVWVRPLAATFQLRAIPETLGCWRFLLAGEESRDAAGLAGAVEFLADREDDLAGSVMIVEIEEKSSTGSVVVLAPGRSRPWDLGCFADDLTRILGEPEPGGSLELDFRRAGELLAGDTIPAWALASPDWTVHSVSSGETTNSRPFPAGIKRFIWQSVPRLVWSPDSGITAPGWHSDVFCAGGRVQPPTRPAASVPLDFLKRMKTLFDPRGALETPEWLEGQDG